MQLFQSKLGGLFFLTIGVALCAAYGARQSDSMFTYLQTRLDTAAARTEATKAFNQYNKIRKEQNLKPIVLDAQPKLTLPEAKETIERQRKATDFIAALTEMSGPHEGMLEQSRQAWLKREKSAINFELDALTHPLPSPTTRLKEWLSRSGLIFLAGIGLIIFGAVLTRRTLEKSHHTGEDSDGQALDIDTIAAMLRDLNQQVSTLSTDARDVKGPTRRDVDTLKNRIEGLQLSHFEPLVASRSMLQQRIGLAAFADVFSPFSSGERNINRAWSTLVDEHWSECLASLGRASLAIKRADDALRQTLETQTLGDQS